MGAPRTPLIFIAGATCGLIVGYLVFGGAHTSVAEVTAPVPPQRPAEAQVAVPTEPPTPRTVVVPVAPTAEGMVDSGTPEAQRIAALEEEIKTLKATMSFDTDRQAEQKGRVPVEAPLGLAARFMNEAALRELWKGALTKAGIPADDINIDCREYPCFVQLKNLAPGELVRILPEPYPPPFENDRTVMRTAGRIMPDGGMFWSAVVGFVPKEEPQDRSEAIAQRVYVRARANNDGGLP